MTNTGILVPAALEFIERQNVTHYFTLTYPRRMSWEGRHKVFLKWVDAIEWMQHRPLGWFRADEMSRFSGLAFPEIPEHHHGLLVDADHLCCRTAESLWRTYGDALVVRYEPYGCAIPYCLKHDCAVPSGTSAAKRCDSGNGARNRRLYTRQSSRGYQG